MPSVQFANPAQFNAGAPLLQGLSSGIGMAANLQDIAAQQEQMDYERSMRPVRQQLADIQLQSAGLGLERDQAALTRAATEQRLIDLAMPEKQIRASQPVVLEENTFLDYDDQGNLVEFKRQKKQDPNTNEISYAPRVYNKTVKTKAQLDAELARNQAQIDSLKALAESRTNKDPKFESELIQKRLEQATKEGDSEEIAFWQARQARLNALPGQLAPGTTFDRGTEKMGLGAGFTKDQIVALGKTQAGINAMRKLDTANTLMKAEKEFNLPELKLTPDEQAAIDAVTKASPAVTERVPVISTKEAYAALPVGAAYIDSETGRQHIKGK